MDGTQPLGVLAEKLKAELAGTELTVTTKQGAATAIATTIAVTDYLSVAGQELLQFIERIERLEAEKRDIAEAIKEVYAEAKGRGYMTVVIRKVVGIRKRSADDLAEEEATLDMYLAALGMR